MGRLIIAAILILWGFSTLFSIDIWHYFWPAVLIILGLYILIGRTDHPHLEWKKSKNAHYGTTDESKENQLHYSAVFQGIDKKVTTDDFKNGKIETVFGGINLDLRNAKLKSKNSVSLKVDAIFGGIKIMLPKNWEVEVDINGFAGGVHDVTLHPGPKETLGKIHIFGSAIFGGVEITN